MIVDAIVTNDSSQQSTHVQWADPIATSRVIEPEAGKAATKIASVTRSGRMAKQPERLIKMIDVSVLATEIRYLGALAELDNNEVNAKNTLQTNC